MNVAVLRCSTDYDLAADHVFLKHNLTLFLRLLNILNYKEKICFQVVLEKHEDQSASIKDVSKE